LTPGPDQRDNNFDFLRQFAAFCVIVGHSQSLVGAPHSAFWGVSVSTFGVQIFFAVSGFLVTESWLRGPKIGSFLKKRTSRIFPGLMVCILLTALVMGPLLTRLPVGEYFDHPGTLLYLKNIFLSPVYFLPGLFEGNTYPNAVNGSLWSLPVEFACYIGVIAAGLVLRRPMPLVAFGIGLGMVVLAEAILAGREPMAFFGSPVRESLAIMPFFVAGSFFRLIQRPGLFRADLAVLAVGVVIAVDQMAPQLYWLVTWFAVPYLVLSFGLSSLPVLRRFGRFGDPSYGMYLYAFPIQQTLQHLSGNSMSLAGMIWITTLFSVLLGLLSWHLIEKPVLDRVKRAGRGPTAMKNGA
jgi:peptidoglycan/LPS O-acetylase OafA/YrhL